MKILIVGAGVSGICLAHTFLEKGLAFKLIDSGNNVSSKIAAGMINPMVFRKMLKTWRGDDLIPYLKDFYPKIEKRIDAKFFFPRKIRRVFSTEEERANWKIRSSDIDYRNYIFPLEETTESPEYVIEKYGSGWVNSPGYIESKIFMHENQRFLRENGLLTLEAFNFTEFDPEKLSYRGESYTHIIFAEGYKMIENPYFNYLPLRHTKGEVLTVRSEQLIKSEILNRKCFVLPTNDELYKIGATFAWNTTDTTITEEAKSELMEQYRNLSSAPVEIVNQEAGIRPTVADRRPMLGEHPKHKGIFIFNGMGTKGYMIAPFFAGVFYSYLFSGKALDAEVDIKRFFKKHYPDQTS
ncbi:MAG: FAD-dependent oxidoreductase [Brumimicrobium sp.]|nr:FAD-dependent oxidoreductase [Brumimicrobium sp.]